MNFRTEIPAPKTGFKISHHDKIVLMGSCFTENIGNKLQSSGFQVDINPFGILYNPLSVASGLKDLLQEKQYTASDIFEYKGLYSSFNHHSRFSALTSGECLSNMNRQMEYSVDFIRKATVLIITFGTSYVYRLKDTGNVVSNCHKLPASAFLHERITISEILSVWQPLIGELRKINPDLNILMTVSPVRHWKDGAHENQLSKSILLLTIEELKSASIDYFPSYELLLDDLRDYRFYAGDMLHPSTTAIEYIWGKFSESYFDHHTMKTIAEYNSIRQALEHRPFNPESEEYKAFLSGVKKKLEIFRNRYHK